ncbi:trypsin 3A1-like [Anopheles stephensi]|uniref:trypsin 3A1-like n=1 Tax=Anopheles stephensi TaxID=30069 RepID=UPI001658C105|nr:trypsin 3A1-like [Anopheles stephensi]
MSLKSLQLTALLAALLVPFAATDDPPANVTDSADDDSNMIVGGAKVNIEEVPYQVALFRGDSLNCGGTIIGPRWILSSYHCVQDLDPANHAVVVGTDKPWQGARIPVKNIVVPSELFDGALYDVAMLQLAQSLHYDETVQCLRLLRSPDALVPGKPATISGFGATRENNLDSPLKAATVSLLAVDKCAKAYPDLMQEQMICAGFEKGGVDSCQGDSGGPLVVDGKLAGIVFFGRGCARPNSPGVYMSVPFFYDWIMNVARSQKLRDDRKICGEFTENYT